MASTPKNTQKDPSTSVAQRPVDSLPAEVMNSGSMFDADILRTLDSFEDAIALVADKLGAPVAVASQELGDGFALLTDKSLLVGQQMLLMEWSFYPGDFGSQFVAVRLMVRDPKSGKVSKYIVNDGGTGICDQLAAYQKNTGRTGGLLVKNGFRKSEYDTDETGKPTSDKTRAKGRGVTFYLDTAE